MAPNAEKIPLFPPDASLDNKSGDLVSLERGTETTEVGADSDNGGLFPENEIIQTGLTSTDEDEQATARALDAGELSVEDERQTNLNSHAECLFLLDQSNQGKVTPGQATKMLQALKQSA